MNRLSISRRGVFVLALGVWAAGASAQPAPVPKSLQITEEALVDVLALDGPEVPKDATTRGFNVTGPQLPKARGSGKANLKITFETGSTVLTAEGAQTVDTVARALQADRLAGFSFRIEGHADPRGTVEQNQQLSERRAQVVVDYLVGRHGILPERLSAAGKGSAELFDLQRPTAPENRRVAIITQK